MLANLGVASILINTPEDEAASQAYRAQMTEVFASGDAERIVRTYATREAPGAYEKTGPELRQALLDNAPAFRLDYNSRRLPFTCEIAGQITAPALFLAGEQSQPGLQRIAQKAAGCLKNAKFVRIPQATHWIPHDQPQKFNEALLGFLAPYKHPVESSADRKKINGIVQEMAGLMESARHKSARDPSRRGCRRCHRNRYTTSQTKRI